MAKIVNREETQTTPIDDLFILPNANITRKTITT